MMRRWAAVGKCRASRTPASTRRRARNSNGGGRGCSAGGPITVAQDWKTIPARLHPGDTTAQRLVADSMKSRLACFWATECGRGCNIKANYQSTTVHLPPALASGNLDIISDAHCREVEVGKDGKARGILFIDKKTGKEQRVQGKVVI